MHTSIVLHNIQDNIQDVKELLGIRKLISMLSNGDAPWIQSSRAAGSQRKSVIRSSRLSVPRIASTAGQPDVYYIIYYLSDIAYIDN